MHFPFSFVETTWTLTFAALLVLLVVLLGRDRVSRYPFFTAAVVMSAIEMLTRRLLADKLPPLTSTTVFLVLADIGVVVTFLVVIELARRAFGGASRSAWAAGALALVAITVTTLWFWGPWPSRQTLFAHSTLGHLRLMQLGAEKGDLFDYFLFILLTLVAVLTGRRFHPGWRSHARQILLGYSLAGITQITVRVAWQKITSLPAPLTQAEFDHRMALEMRLLNANSLVYLAVAVIWLLCLWFDEPGAATTDAEPAFPSVASPAGSGATGSGAMGSGATESGIANAAGAQKIDPIAAALNRAIGPDAGPSAGKPPNAT
jgi:hypothetical protein